MKTITIQKSIGQKNREAPKGRKMPILAKNREENMILEIMAERGLSFSAARDYIAGIEAMRAEKEVERDAARIALPLDLAEKIIADYADMKTKKVAKMRDFIAFRIASFSKCDVSKMRASPKEIERLTKVYE